MLSIIVMAYREPYLNRTIDSILKNAVGEIEILVIVDGYVPSEPVIEDPRVKVTYNEKNLGMRGCINKGLELAKGEFVMKIDAHCALAPGFDKVLTEDCKENWLMIPRELSLEEETWTPSKHRPARDFFALSFPGFNSYGLIMSPHAFGRPMEGDITDTMSFQGSGWVANRKYFMEHVGYLNDKNENGYGTFAQDQQEVGLKYWLGGGEVKVNKKTWYAHLSKRGWHYDKGMFSRKYKKGSMTAQNNTWGTKHWMNDEEPGMIHKLEWLVEKFWPLPGWPDNWKEKWQELNSKY